MVESHDQNTQPTTSRSRNDLLCVEVDIKPYYMRDNYSQTVTGKVLRVHRCNISNSAIAERPCELGNFKGVG